MKLGLIQMTVVDDKEANLLKAEGMIQTAVLQGANAILLPEMFNCPYDNACFGPYAEETGGATYNRMSNWAKTYGVLLIAGSVPEIEVGKLYNTAYIFDENGACLGKHRKTHLFDIDVKGSIRFMESETLTAGEGTTVVETRFGKVGVCICYDIRFPEFARKMALEGARIILVPAAFNMTTGPAHWELTARARALDNQVYYGLCSPARVMGAGYVAYGHSLITNPWGEVVAEMDEKEGILIQKINFGYEEEVREQLPLLKHRRNSVYLLND
ncbi:MAG: carbon-nitrogen hydrolase family protein [Clostridia bacterium]|nr:carbon-nitrogen hydrolase family protein [Clostridia bacterium]